MSNIALTLRIEAGYGDEFLLARLQSWEHLAVTIEHANRGNILVQILEANPEQDDLLVKVAPYDWTTGANLDEAYWLSLDVIKSITV